MNYKKKKTSFKASLVHIYHSCKRQNAQNYKKYNIVI